MKASIYRSLEWIFIHMVPDPWRYRVAARLAWLVWRFNPRRRAVLEGNLIPLVGKQQAGPTAKTLLVNFAATAVDFYCHRVDPISQVSIDNLHLIETAFRQGGRLMLVTAHVGYWEIGLSCLVERNYPVAGVYSPFADPGIDRWMKRHRDPRVEWIPVGSGVTGRCLEALKRRRIVGLVADVPFGEAGSAKSLAGQPVRMPRGPWIIAQRAKACVLPCFIVRQSAGRYRAIVHDPIKPSVGSGEEEIEHNIDVFTGYVGDYLRRYPDQWGLLTPFWEASPAIRTSMAR